MIKKYHVSKNLFDKSTATLGYYVNSSTGELTQSGNFFASDYIPIEQGKTYYWNDSTTRSNAGCFYDSNKNRVSGWSNQVSNVQYFTTPTNVAYVRLTGARANIDNMQLNTGSTALPYEPYGDSFKDWFYREYGTETETFTSLPKTIIGDGQPIISWSMDGNMQVNGTPTPQNPITPAETGDKTANLSNVYEYTNDNTDTRTYFVLRILLSKNGSQTETFSSSMQGTGEKSFTFTLTTEADTMRIVHNGSQRNLLIEELTGEYSGTYTYSFDLESNDPTTLGGLVLNDIMLNTGSTALPYEPYGMYKIPILSNDTTYPVYLAEPIRKIGTAVDSMASTGTANRVIKKWTLTGTENFEWKKSTAYSGGFYTSWHNSFGGIQNGQFYCSHAQYVSNITDYQQNTCYSDGSCNIRIMQSSSTVQDWIDYLSQQYAAGTPVTVWYVLETPTTETFTAPSIPTSGSPQSFDVSTTLKPSEVSLTYHGWHEHEDTKFTT